MVDVCERGFSPDTQTGKKDASWHAAIFFDSVPQLDPPISCIPVPSTTPSDNQVFITWAFVECSRSELQPYPSLTPFLHTHLS